MKTYTFRPRRQSKVDKCITTIFYVRRPFMFKFTTKHQKRRQWKRRKHNFEYVLYLNILSLWSTEYIFYRKLIKFNYNYCIMKSSLIVYNLANLRGTSPALAKNSEHTYIATLPKSIINYCSKLNFNVFKYWYQTTNSSLIIGSYFLNDSNEVLKQIFKNYFTHPSYIYTTSTLVSHNALTNNNLIDVYNNLFNVLLPDHHYAVINELYKIHILLVINHLYNKNIN